jgi:hypothetical protein
VRGAGAIATAMVRDLVEMGVVGHWKELRVWVELNVDRRGGQSDRKDGDRILEL